jgi:hypothetical protein
MKSNLFGREPDGIRRQREIVETLRVIAERLIAALADVRHDFRDGGVHAAADFLGSDELLDLCSIKSFSYIDDTHNFIRACPSHRGVSAFRIAAPAAPRMVLWLQSRNL